MIAVPSLRPSRRSLLLICGAFAVHLLHPATIEAQALARWDLTGHESHTPAQAVFSVTRETSGRIEVNGNVVFEGILADANLLPVTGPTSSAGTNLHPPPPQWYLHIPIADPSILIAGENQILLTVFSSQTPLLVELQLAVFEAD